MHKIFGFIKKHKKEITNIITFGVIALMAYYLYKNREIFSSLKELDIQYVIYIFILQILSVFLIALNNKKVIGLLNYHIDLKEAFLLQYSNSLLNKIVSEGGAVFRGVFLKEVYKLPYTKYISTIAGLYVINFITNSIIGLISLAYIYFKYGRISYLVLAFFILILISMLILTLVNPRFKNSKENRVINWINSILEGWGTIKRDKKKLLIFVFLSIASLLLTTLQAIFVYKGLGYTLGLFESTYMSSLGMITTFVNITPDSIGVKEAVYMFTSDIIGLESDIILLGSLIIRAIALINTFLIGGISYLKLTPRLKGVKNSK
ncbi:MAG: hypothetical protein XD93_0088 [candidate division WS6 bacterium 34_10]|uniref:Lysylphosphatidylglycerol synthetase/UPF0104 n=1 Tax=candidate division WS6 bacterium 34_10 TaxID=1641389 RepID=A0A117M0L8_9BACT|nr:MAG: hypothetical protein XD93_0088 [candidate division WS6 bacterium 34_10]